MSNFLARNRLILLAYAGMVVLLLVTAMFSPGFLSASNLRSTVVLAAFVGIVALGQTFVIIGGGIDLSVPWVLNSAAIIMALLCAGQDMPLIWVAPLVLGRRAALIGLINGVGVAHFGVPPIIMTLATNVILQGLILVMTGGSPTPSAPALIKFLSVGRIGPFPGHRADLDRADADRHAAAVQGRVRPASLCARHQRDGRRILRRADGPDDHPHLCHLGPHGSARRHAAHRLFGPGLSRHGRRLSLHLDRGGRDRRRVDPRRQRPLSRHGCRRAGA